MNDERLSSAKHEVRHALMAWQYQYEVESCSLEGSMPETVVLFRLGKSQIRKEAHVDPLGTSYELQSMLAVALINGHDSSPSDLARTWIWQAQWPASITPSWSTIERNARLAAEEWLCFKKHQLAIVNLAVRLNALGRMEGAKLYRAMHHTMNCSHPVCHCNAMLGPLE